MGIMDMFPHVVWDLCPRLIISTQIGAVGTSAESVRRWGTPPHIGTDMPWVRAIHDSSWGTAHGSCAHWWCQHAEHPAIPTTNVGWQWLVATECVTILMSMSTTTCKASWLEAEHLYYSSLVPVVLHGGHVHQDLVTPANVAAW